MLRQAARLAIRFGRGGGRGSGGGNSNRQMRFDGSASGYVFVALIGGIVGFGIGRESKVRKDKESHKGGRHHHKADHHRDAQHETVPSSAAVTAITAATGPSMISTTSTVSAALPFSSPPIQPWTPPALDDGSAPPSIPLLTSLTAEQVASHPLLRAIGPYGLPSLPFRSSIGAPSPPFHLSSPMILRQAFISAWNSKTHTPDWCLQMITDNHHQATSALDVSRDQSSFKSDPLIASSFQPSSSSYRHSGWDRGHMVPAADVIAVDGVAQDTLDESFQWSNICPQDARLNRGYWAQLEHHVRKMARGSNGNGGKPGSTVFVVTGPLWIPEQVERPAPQRPTSRNNNENASLDDSSNSLLSLDAPASSTGSNGNNGVGLQLRAEVLGSVPSGFVTVPTHFFKVVLVVPADVATTPASAATSSLFTSSGAPSPLQLAAFIVPNAPVPLTTPLRSFQVPLEHVEMHAGWQMFGRLQRSATNGKRGNNAQIRDLCAAGGCEMKIKDFAFNRK